MRIIIFTHNYPVNSSERRNAGIFVHDFAKELARSNTVAVVCPTSFNKRSLSQRPYKKIKIDGVIVYFFNYGGNKHLGKLRFWNPFDLLRGFSLLRRGFKTLSVAVRETKPDFSLAMWAIPGGFFSYITKVRFGIPYAVWVLGSDFYVYAKIPIFGFFIRHVLKSARHTFADGVSLSGEVAKVTRKRCIFLSSSTTFDFPLSRRARKIDKNETVLTFIGRMEEIKGPDLFLDSLIKLKNQIQNFKINFIGDGNLLSLLKERAVKESINKYVRFYGNINNKEKIMEILGGSDWLVIPSRSDSIPLVFSESMKMGIPIIAAALPDLKYLIDKYKVGVYFNPGDINGLSEIIKNLPRIGKKRKTLSLNTGIARQNFNLETSAARFLQIINE